MSAETLNYIPVSLIQLASVAVSMRMWVLITAVHVWYDIAEHLKALSRHVSRKVIHTLERGANAC